MYIKHKNIDNKGSTGFNKITVELETEKIIELKTYSAISGEFINLVRTSTAIRGLFSTNS